jgi:N-methylhydantoinase B
MTGQTSEATAPTLNPVTLAVMANRVDGIVREMSNTLLRAGRSAVINSARDFSCAVTTADNQLFSSAEGLPVHIFGSHLQSKAMCDLHPDLSEGDAFLHNDPYLGNTHPADHTILVPVFFEGEHLFTACAKAHQADIGNSIPTTYHAAAKDVYEEGSLIFPCVRVQRNHEMNDDIVRMCRSRIRVPEQWYGDFLAGIGAARIGERRLKAFCAKYGKDTVKRFIQAWLDYSEKRMVQAISKMPKARFEHEGRHDKLMPLLPDGIPIKVKIAIDPERAEIEIDLRDNIDCLDCGFNESEACTTSNVMNGVLNCLDPGIPANSGAFRRVRLLLRDNCVVGRPQFPHSCSMATTNVADRLVNITQSAFGKLGDGFGVAEGGNAMNAGFAVVSGNDYRRGGAPYINQLIIGSNGGPASPRADGWVTFGTPVVAGLMYRDSVEIDELKHPVLFDSLRLVRGSGGAGKFRGAPGTEIVYGPRKEPMTVIIPSDAHDHAPRGVRGGVNGTPAATYRVSANGDETKQPNVVTMVLQPGEKVRGLDCGGGGYGKPWERDAERVRHDVLEGWETPERARDVYGVALVGSDDSEDLAVDMDATTRLRAAMSA